MGKPNFSDEFKRDAVAQIIERGYPVAEVSQRLGVSQHSLYAWKRQLAKVVSGDASKDAEIRQLKRELARVTEERDILKKATAYFARDAKRDTRLGAGSFCGTRVSFGGARKACNALSLRSARSTRKRAGKRLCGKRKPRTP